MLNSPLKKKSSAFGVFLPSGALVIKLLSLNYLC